MLKLFGHYVWAQAIRLGQSCLPPSWNIHVLWCPLVRARVRISISLICQHLRLLRILCYLLMYLTMNQTARNMTELNGTLARMVSFTDPVVFWSIVLTLTVTEKRCSRIHLLGDSHNLRARCTDIPWHSCFTYKARSPGDLHSRIISSLVCRALIKCPQIPASYALIFSWCYLSYYFRKI